MSKWDKLKCKLSVVGVVVPSAELDELIAAAELGEAIKDGYKSALENNEPQTIVDQIWDTEPMKYARATVSPYSVPRLAKALAEAVEFINKHKDEIGVGLLPRACMDNILEILDGRKSRKIPK